MRNIAVALLCSLLAFSAFSQNVTVLNNMVNVVYKQTVEGMAALLKGEGYKEVSHPAFQQKGLRVFTKTTQRGPDTYILESCGGSLTGYYTSLTNPQYLILTNDLDVEKYKTVGNEFYKYRKGDITVELMHDYSVVTTFEQSDTYGAIKDYVHISRKNACYGDGSSNPLAPAFNFQPGSVEACLANLSLKQYDVSVAMAKSSLFESSANAAEQIFQYAKEGMTMPVQFCGSEMYAFTLLVPKSTGRSLDESLKKAGFKQLQEQTGERNSYSRVYQSTDYVAVLYYYGDVKDEDERAYAYQVAFAKAKNPCKK